MYSSNAVSNPIPFLDTQVTPSHVTAGAQGVTLTVHGTGFLTTSSVLWNGQPLPTTFVNIHTLNARVPASALTIPTTATITVRNPAPGGGTSNSAYFAVTWTTPTAILFETRTFLGSTNTSLVSADFNSDGKLDLAAAAGSSIAILLGNGDGTFKVSSVPTSTPSVGALATGDFNHDGKPDLVFTDATHHLLHILLGDGDGTFNEVTTTTVGSNPDWVAAADFNHDGNLDLAVINRAGPNVWILLGNGTGTFVKKSVTNVGVRPNALSIGDFNGDGQLDLAVVNSASNNLSILLGKGDGTFTLKSSPATGLSPYGITAADFNGDGKLDLAVTNFCGTGAICSSTQFGSVSILLGAGDGTFTSTSYDLYALHEPVGIVAGDFNADGKADLAIAVQSENLTALALGNGKGGFNFATPVLTDAASTPLSLVAGDFNNDGRLDFAVTNTGAFADLLDVSVERQSPVAFYPGVLTFPPQTFGTTSAPRTLKLTNIGLSPLHISNIQVIGYFAGTNNCPATLAKGASCTFTITFTPQFVGLTGGAVRITDDALGVVQTGTLEGTGK